MHDARKQFLAEIAVYASIYNITFHMKNSTHRLSQFTFLLQIHRQQWQQHFHHTRIIKYTCHLTPLIPISLQKPIQRTFSKLNNCNNETRFVLFIAPSAFCKSCAVRPPVTFVDATTIKTCKYIKKQMFH